MRSVCMIVLAAMILVIGYGSYAYQTPHEIAPHANSYAGIRLVTNTSHYESASGTYFNLMKSQDADVLLEYLQKQRGFLPYPAGVRPEGRQWHRLEQTTLVWPFQYVYDIALVEGEDEDAYPWLLHAETTRTFKPW